MHESFTKEFHPDSYRDETPLLFVKVLCTPYFERTIVGISCSEMPELDYWQIQNIFMTCYVFHENY